MVLDSVKVTANIYYAVGEIAWFVSLRKQMEEATRDQKLLKLKTFTESLPMVMEAVDKWLKEQTLAIHTAHKLDRVH